jgi:hypothetical protein
VCAKPIVTVRRDTCTIHFQKFSPTANYVLVFGFKYLSMNLKDKVKIKWNSKEGVVVSITSRRENSPNLIAFYLIKTDDGKIEEYTRDQIRPVNK